jgi:hypothetical protein
MPRARGTRVKVHVKLGSLQYGFLTQEAGHEQHKAILGQTAYTNAAGVFFGANSPKPPRATFNGSAVSSSPEAASSSFSSFCGTDKVKDIKKTAGWTVQEKTRRRGILNSAKSVTVYVEMPGGWKYAWNITKSDLDLRTDLGFVQAGAQDAAELIWGVDSPKPPRAVRKNANGQIESSFIKPQASVIDAAAAKGWTVSGIDYALIPNA